ncbi:MAG: D-alanyl-D-alanine carboxypeptidase [Bacteroidetes bacterium]|nr:D-alanyl-D-alanine carboxypeptidase [Bacteroidota bacterium]
MKHARNYFFLLTVLLLSLFACQTPRYTAKKALQHLLRDSISKQAHVGIAIWDLDKKKYVLRYQHEKYFVPASNVKIATLYTALKYLPDSLPAFDVYETKDSLLLLAKGDPTFLRSDFNPQKSFERLRSNTKPIVLISPPWNTEVYGKGWAWEDRLQSYMPERSAMPLYGNCLRNKSSLDTAAFIPFETKGIETAAALLSDTLGVPVVPAYSRLIASDSFQTIYSFPTDSVAKKMMHQSDNFLAEQLLLASGLQQLGSFNEKAIIAKTTDEVYASSYMRPSWVDGSGLSRHNLFTPDDFIQLLQQLEKEFGSDRMLPLFPTGGEGTLKEYFLPQRGKIFAKTGTLSGHAALSGFIVKENGIRYLFSILINHHHAPAKSVRKALERFVCATFFNKGRP